jgi:hypothetical protein
LQLVPTAKECLYSLTFREEVFSETELPVYGVLGIVKASSGYLSLAK